MDFGLALPEDTIERSAAPLPEMLGGNERYLYVPNWYDQTLSVIDTDDDTVVATITLTSSKNFSAIFYRAINDSVYLFGDLYFDRIDANPSSGTFNTVVESGASACNDNGTNLTYIPWPLDLILNSGANVRVNRFIEHNNATAAGKQYNIYARNSGIYTNSNLGLAAFGHSVGVARFAPKSGMIFFRSEQSYKYRILHSTKNIDSNGPYTFVQEPWQMDLDRLGLVGNGYIFGNMVLPGSSGSVYKQVRGIDTSPLGTSLLGGSGGVTPSFTEYCPIYGKGAGHGLYVYAGKTTLLASVFEIGYNTYTDLGDLDRAAYKATNETGTDAMHYNHRNHKLYMRGYANSGSLGTAVCNKVHVYDMTLAIGSMYLTSITVGNLQSVQKQAPSPTNNMTFNQTKYYEALDVIL